MRIEKWNQDWTYWIEKDAFALVWNIPNEAEQITLPHDAMAFETAYAESGNHGSTGYRDGHVYHYVKHLFVTEEEKGETILIKFEGVYCNAFVYVNGQLAAKNPFGYNTFYVSIQEFLKYGCENEIRVIVRNGAMTNSRWYSGGGIYRDVSLLKSGYTYFIPDGLCVTVEEVDQAFAVLRIAAEIKNRAPFKRDLILKTEIFDEDENLVKSEWAPIALFEQEERRIQRRVTVTEPKLWSEAKPGLYTVRCTIFESGCESEENLLDSVTSRFGIRTLSVNAVNGLRVNGIPVKLRGACIHHDSGLLGAATYEEAQYRQVKKLKEAGFNAIRMSHHPMAESMLRACDELGVYVMDETFDMWTRGKSDYDYSMYFSECWQSDVTAMVRKDYNHPSVILYSIGNEIPEIGTDLGTKIGQEICDLIRSQDSSRFTLASINGVFAAGDEIGAIMSDIVADMERQGEPTGNVNNFMSLLDSKLDQIVTHERISKRLERACVATDIAGYNYMTARYEMDQVSYPDRVIVGSETYPPEIARNWEIIMKNPHVIGDFTWTGWDYIGEAGVGIPAYQWGEGGFGAGFPCQLAYCGDFDITGQRRPASYFREIVFGLRKEPYITVQNPAKFGEKLIKTPWVISDAIASWTYPGHENKPLIIEVYAPGDEVELWCNDKVVGRKTSGVKAGFRVLFEAVYEPGVLKAVVYEQGEEISSSTLQTTGSVSKILAEPEDTKQTELIYIPIRLLDDQNRLVMNEDTVIEVTVSGDAIVAGLGSGEPKPSYSYFETKTKTFYGTALLILKKADFAREVSIEMITDSSLDLKLAITL
ncbi:MAG: glycoside hydrolase family 2 TIM barrel-domain containing protein [Lachnospiraceae bacterium]